NAPGLQSISNYKFVNIAASALVFYIIVFTSISVYDMVSIFSYNSQKSAFEAKFNELNSPSAADERNKINERYAAFNKKKIAREVIEFKKNSLDKALASISAQLPDGTIISSINFINEAKPVLMLNGSAGEYAKVIMFSDELKKNNSFSKVSMKKSEQKASRVEFQFDCELGPGKAD
ncbi:MAG TPA: PilN domain-containing protein, partial [Candidatus Wallbacteria bacterium]|nr:PilN domain-containing protein [Candidatus Wallbacteria bacterium]